MGGSRQADRRKKQKRKQDYEELPHDWVRIRPRQLARPDIYCSVVRKWRSDYISVRLKHKNVFAFKEMTPSIARRVADWLYEAADYCELPKEVRDEEDRRIRKFRKEKSLEN